MEKIYALISKLAISSKLSKDEIESYLKSGLFKVVHYNKNSIVHLEGEHCSKLEVIISGKIVVDRIDEMGNLLTIAEFFSDDVLGGNLLFSTAPYYPLTVTAKNPSAVLEIEKELLFKLCSTNSNFLRFFLGIISDQAFMLGDKIRRYVNRTIREQILDLLERECKIQNSNRIQLGITKKALAERIGVQRTSLSRELAKMKADGLIDFDDKTITLLK
ncbi:MAG TPA: Crp/Fnr family transcriptional regulator [Clostridiales bacterium]|nr:Crp/Fnr family transcriptional regulator [Clostridiales bacterium]